MIARDVMTDRVVAAGPGYSIRQAVAVMLDNRISGLPAVDDGLSTPPAGRST